MIDFLYKKAVMKTRGPGKIPREVAILVQGSRNPAGDDTTSEPRGRNAPTGAPVTVPMSGFPWEATRVEPWNTNICIPPLIHSGVGIFYTLPKAEDMRFGI